MRPGADQWAIKNRIVNSVAQRGTLHQQLQQSEAAAEMYERAIKLSQDLIAVRPQAESQRDQLGRFLFQLGTIRSELHDVKSARKRFQECLAVYEKLVKEFPESDTYRSNVSTLRKKLGSIQR